jgi:hypothetical protein
MALRAAAMVIDLAWSGGIRAFPPMRQKKGAWMGHGAFLGR